MILIIIAIKVLIFVLRFSLFINYNIPFQKCNSAQYGKNEEYNHTLNRIYCIRIPVKYSRLDKIADKIRKIYGCNINTECILPDGKRTEQNNRQNHICVFKFKKILQKLHTHPDDNKIFEQTDIK